MASIWDHLDELSHRLRIIVYSVIISSTAVAAFPIGLTKGKFELSELSYSPLIGDILKRVQTDLLPKEASLIAHSWWDPIWCYLLLSLLFGVIISSPVIAYEMYKFLNPALLPTERKILSSFIISIVVLFLAGGVFAYKFILPVTFLILMKFTIYSGALPIFALQDFVSFLVWSMVGMGFAFTFPVWTTLAVKLGWLSAQTLASNRKVAVICIIVIAGIITPDPTILSMLILSVPLLVLYEFSVWVSRWVKVE
ncbi:MAG: twin-arginine translocase subunit TatC [Euryarchaeota archaeon]|nr:twin-arginine translocase subunit TatC [Euryarchaeota archaeon]